MDFLKKDSIFSGFVFAVLLTALSVAVIFMALYLLGADLLVQMKLFLFACVPEILLMRWQAKNENHQGLKGTVLALVVTIIPLIVFLWKMNYLN